MDVAVEAQSNPVFDIDELLGPISEETPTGVDIREDYSPTSAYQQIKDARNRARSAERQAMFDESSASTLGEWAPVLELAPEILKNQAKDLEILAWYIEALIRAEGFAGLRDGLILAHRTVAGYWDNLFPEPDEDGLETKVSAFTGLNGEGGEGTLLAPIRNVPLTQGRNQDPIAYWQYQQALEIEKIPDDKDRQERIATLNISMDLIQKEVQAADASFFATLVADIEACQLAFKQLNDLFDEHCGHESPPSSNIRNVLEEVLGAVKHMARDKLALISPITDADNEESTDEPGIAGQAQTANLTNTEQIVAQSIRSREEAFEQLLRISEYFRRTEPHSPVSYAVSKAVRWGRMPLYDLMRELLPDEDAKETYQSLTGVKLLEDDDDDD